MQTYRHTQKATSLLWTLGGAAALVLMFGAAAEEGRSIALLVGATLLSTMFIFSSLTVEVTEKDVRLSFGPGIVRRSFPLTDIAETRVVSNPWYYGLGVHLTSQGWLFNVAGPDAVELTFKSGPRVRIGSDEAPRLRAAIDAAISRS